jgi:outer membrane murein-binding lipoprotein Lpp
MRKIVVLGALVLSGCAKGQSSNQQNLSAAANQSTPEAAQVLNGAAQNGMDANAALSEAANAQASNTSATAAPRFQARPNSASNPNPRRPGLPPEKIVTNSE